MANINLEQLSKKIKATLDETSRGVKISLFNGIIRDTRVDTGRLRGNWQTTNDRMAKGQLDRLDPTKQGVDGGSSQDEVTQNVKAFTTDYLTNNLPYAGTWEERDGMIRKNIERIGRNISELKDIINA